MHSQSRSILGWLSLFFVLIGCLWLLFSPANITLPAYVQSKRNLSIIGLAMLRYSEVHERLPLSLSDLVPEYVTASNTVVFFPPSTTNPPKSLSDFRDRVASDGAYDYLGNKGVSIDILMYERLDQRLSSSTRNEISTLGTNFAVKTYTREEVQRRLHEIGLDVLIP